LYWDYLRNTKTKQLARNFQRSRTQSSDKENYYTEKAKKLDLIAPLFNENETTIGKIVSSEKLESVLGYRFRNLG